MRLPNSPGRDEDILTWAQQVNECLRSLLPQPAADIWPGYGGVGVRFQLRPRKAGGGSGAAPTPFQVSIIPKTGSPGSYQASVYPGSLNLQLPSNIATPIDLTAEPLIVLNGTTDGKQVTSSVLAASATYPSPPGYALGAGPTTFSVPIALLQYTGTPSVPSVSSQIVHDNLVAQLALAAQSEKASIALGTSPWQNWWTWAVSENVLLFY